jgi:cold shock CspA family protein
MPQYTGQLKFWSTKGYGFLIRDGANSKDGNDLLHATALEIAQINPESLKPGARFSYDLVIKQDNRPSPEWSTVTAGRSI